MPALTKEFLTFGVRESFNQTLRHLVHTSSMVDQVEKGENLATLLNRLLEQGLIQREQALPIISLMLVHRLKAAYKSFNLKEAITDFKPIVERFQNWNALDVTMVYHVPNVGATPINPANEEHWEQIHDLKKDELVVVYVRHLNGKAEVAERGLQAMIAMLSGQQASEDPDFIDRRKLEMEKARQEAIARARADAEAKAAREAAARAAAPAGAAAPAAAPSAPAAPAAPAAGGKKMQLTPKYSVQVSNELFHNGNVEAWKNIIESYHESHPGSKVIVYHESELIQDLNSLFKWGKVKHGGLIFFQIAGQQIKNVSRLQKYLYEGASPRFEAFLKHDVNRTLNLF